MEVLSSVVPPQQHPQHTLPCAPQVGMGLALPVVFRALIVAVLIFELEYLWMYRGSNWSLLF